MVETGDDHVAVAAEAVGVGAISQEARRGQTSEEDSSPVGSEVETELVTKTGHCWGVWERGLWRREEGGELPASLLRTPGTVLFFLARAVSGE